MDAVLKGGTAATSALRNTPTLVLGSGSESSGSDSGSGDPEAMTVIAIILSVIYFFVLLRALQVIYFTWPDRHLYKATQAQDALLVGDVSTKEAKTHTSYGGPAVLQFYVVCAIFAASRTTIWAITAKMHGLEDSNVQLTVVAIPSLFYFAMLFILVNSWWQAFDALVSTIEHQGNGVHGKLRGPFAITTAILWTGTVAFYLYCIISHNLGSASSDQSNILLIYTSTLFFIVGMLFIFVGVGVYSRLGDLPYNYPGILALKQRVFIITLAVGPSCIIRAALIIFQVTPDTNFISHLEDSRFFPFVFYLFFEIIPVVVVMKTLQPPHSRPGDDDETIIIPAQPQSARGLGTSAPSIDFKPDLAGSRTSLSAQRHFQSGACTTVAPLGLNLSGRRLVASPQLQPLDREKPRQPSAFSPSAASQSGDSLEQLHGTHKLPVARHRPPPASNTPPSQDDSVEEDSLPSTARINEQ